MILDQKHLNLERRDKLKDLLNAKIAAFQGTRSCWKGKPIELELKSGSKPFCAKAYKITKAYNDIAKKEVARL